MEWLLIMQLFWQAEWKMTYSEWMKGHMWNSVMWVREDLMNIIFLLSAPLHMQGG
jgi:hypothetical protein